MYTLTRAPQVALVVRNPPANAGDEGDDPWVGKIPWRRAWQPIPVFLPGESPWTEEPGRLQSMGSERVRHDWVTKHSTAILFGGLLNCRSSLYVLDINPLSDISFASNIPHGLLSHSANGVLRCTQVLNSEVFQFIYFFLCCLWFCLTFKKPFSWKPPWFFSYCS